MPARVKHYDIIVIGGGHAGAEAAWAGANLGARVAFVTMDPAKIGTMSCNPAIGGLAKGQMVREIDALGGLMGLATDATGIQFRMLNLSKGAAVWGPRAQCDKYAYAREVQRLIHTREQIDIHAGTVDDILVEGGKVTGIVVKPTPAAMKPADCDSFDEADWLDSVHRGAGSCCAGEFDGTYEDEPYTLLAGAVVLTTGTFMRGLMHTGESKTAGGRVGENAAVGISGTLTQLGFELGRLKTGTPPRLARQTIDFTGLELQPGDDNPVPFSAMTDTRTPGAFPRMAQTPCWITHTNEASHEMIRANLDRAPMYNGQIETAGPRYCPSIEDKVVRFADKHSHHVFLEPESYETNEIYCNGISTSLPADVQDVIVRNLPGCENATILRYGYAVEYDMVWPHQIDATCMTKRVAGLFLAGQINGTSGYEEAAGQGLIAGLNAVRFVRGQELLRLRRDQAYIGVLLDDLVTKTPREPYRMFTSRAEFRLLLRGDNADDRLTPLGRAWGLVDDARWQVFESRRDALLAAHRLLKDTRYDGKRLLDWARQPAIDLPAMKAKLAEVLPSETQFDERLWGTVLADVQYEGYIRRQEQQVQQLAEQEQATLPASFDYAAVQGLRREAANTLTKFQPTTLGQAGRLAGVTPADLMVVSIALNKANAAT
jgi:tRNA uridine 5-carboxymethylaminomethyl modification enzyme